MTMLDNRTWTLADRLRKARQMAGLEQADMAALLEVARTTISSYETGKSEPTVTGFVLWAEATRASLDWLALGVVRPEGFEPPAYCSVADDGPCPLCGEECATFADWVTHTWRAHPRRDELELAA